MSHFVLYIFPGMYSLFFVYNLCMINSLLSQIMPALIQVRFCTFCEKPKGKSRTTCRLVTTQMRGSTKPVMRTRRVLISLLKDDAAQNS